MANLTVHGVCVVNYSGSLTFYDDTSVNVTAHAPNQMYATIDWGANYNIAIDLSKMILREPNLDPDQSILDFLTQRLTDAKVAGYTSNKIPMKDPYTKKYEHRMDAIDVIASDDYDITYATPTHPTVRDDIKRKGECDDLVITPKNLVEFSNSLVFVNGIYHASSPYNNELWVWDGFANIRRSKQRDVLLLDTTKIGGHTAYDITEDMIISDKNSISSGVRISLPSGVTLNGKTLLLIVDGYLLVDRCRSIINETTFDIDIGAVDPIYNYLQSPMSQMEPDIIESANRAADPYYQSIEPVNDTDASLVDLKANSDTSTLFIQDPQSPHGVLPTSKTSVPLSQMSDVWVLSRLLLKTSQIILINNPNVYITRYPLCSSGVPNEYECYSKDTPRGFLNYDGKTLPFTIMSSMGGEHVVYTDAVDANTGIYRTAPTPSQIPNRLCDVTDDRLFKNAELVELYAP